MAKRIRIKKGTIKDASLIEADKGEYGKPREEDAKTRRSKMDHRRQRIMRSITATMHILLSLRSRSFRSFQ